MNMKLGEPVSRTIRSGSWGPISNFNKINGEISLDITNMLRPFFDALDTIEINLKKSNAFR